MNRKPSRHVLPHTITLWNLRTIRPKQYQKSILRFVRHNFRKQTNVLTSGNTSGDSLELIIANGVSLAAGEDGIPRQFVPSPVFLSATQEEQNFLWTLNPGDDYVGIGIVEGMPSTGGELAGTDYKITAVNPQYGTRSDVHHWEVLGR